MSNKFQKNGPYQKHFVAEWRAHFDLSQEELATRIGASKATISRLENYENGYSQDLVEAIAETLDISPAALVGIDPSDANDIWTLWAKADEKQRRLITTLATGVLSQGSAAA